MSLASQLAQGLAELGVELAPSAEEQLLRYVALLAKWNRVYNLTGVREPTRMLAYHVLDSLAVVPHVAARTVLDVGSGAGLPGIPLAVALPQTRVTLLEARHKKAAFLRQAAIELALGNVEVVCERAERWHPQQRFELVISRAFGDLARLAAAAGSHVAPGGTLAAMCSARALPEGASCPPGFRLRRVQPLRVPGVRGARELVLLEPAQ